MRTKKVAHGCQRPPFYARAGCCARNYAVCKKSSKARPGSACTQEVMRAKKVAHGCQRPPFYVRASNCARRRPQRPFYARASYCARRRPQRPRFDARAGCCARCAVHARRVHMIASGLRNRDLAYVTRRNEVMGVLGVVKIAARFPLPLPTDELM
jgi:hypothetical protein